MDFNLAKKNALEKADKSSKGKIDDDIVELVMAINRCEEYFTSSSCSGRIALILMNSEFQKHESTIVFQSHTTVIADQVRNVVAQYKDVPSLWLRSEPFILHVCCKTLETAEQLLKFCQQFGLKRSGITSTRKLTIEIGSTEKMDVPLIDNGELVITELAIIVKKANERLLRTKEKLIKFTEAFASLPSPKAK